MQQHAKLWRISNDVWDLWSKSLTSQVFLSQFAANSHCQLRDARPPQPESEIVVNSRPIPIVSCVGTYAGPGHWPDADMLSIGYLGPVLEWGREVCPPDGIRRPYHWQADDRSVRCDQPRVFDLHARGGRKVESLPPEILDEVLAKTAAIFQ